MSGCSWSPEQGEGFVFPSSEIYDGLSAAYDYGQLGSELKNNLKQYWWTAMVRMNDNIVGIDAAIFMHPTTWKASGHVDAFNDPLIDNKDSKKRYRADVLIEDFIAKIVAKINKDVAKGLKRFGDDFNEEEFRSTNPNVLRRQQKIDDINAKFKAAMDAEALRQLDALQQLPLSHAVTQLLRPARVTVLRQPPLHRRRRLRDLLALGLGSISSCGSRSFLIRRLDLQALLPREIRAVVFHA